MTPCTICGLPCPGMPEAGTAFCAECFAANMAGNNLENRANGPAPLLHPLDREWLLEERDVALQRAAMRALRVILCVLGLLLPLPLHAGALW